MCPICHPIGNLNAIFSMIVLCACISLKMDMYCLTVCAYHCFSLALHRVPPSHANHQET